MPAADRAAPRWGACVAVLALLLVRPASSAGASGFLARVLRFLGVTVSPGELKGTLPNAPSGGQIIVVDVPSGSARVLTAAGGRFTWPIFTADGRAIVALRGDELVTVSVDKGTLIAKRVIHGVTKLIGVDRDHPDQVLVLQREPAAPVALLSLRAGTLASLPFDRNAQDQRRIVAHLQSEERVYGDVHVFVRTVTKPGAQGQGLHDCEDVYFETVGAPPHALSACDGASFRQPTLSPDGRRAAYVRLE